LYCFYSGASVFPAARGALFVIGAKLRLAALQSTCAAGGYFFSRLSFCRGRCPQRPLWRVPPDFLSGVGAATCRPGFASLFVLLLIGCNRRPAAQGALFVIAAKLRLASLLYACAAGGYFFRFAGKSNQKGATSLEEAIFFIRELRCGNRDVAFPRDVLRWSARTLAHRRTQGHSLSRGCILG
jgi:hypothetical protein